MDRGSHRKGLSRSPDGGVSHFEIGQRRIHYRAWWRPVRQFWTGNRLRRGSAAELSKVGERVARRLGTAIPGRRSANNGSGRLFGYLAAVSSELTEGNGQ